MSSDGIFTGNNSSMNENVRVNDADNFEDAFENKVSGLSILNEKLKYEIAVRKRTEEVLEQRTRLLSTLLDVSNLVSSTLELKPLLEAILDRLKTIIEYKGAKVFIISGDNVKLFAHRSILTETEAQDYTLPVNSALLGVRIVIDRKPMFISDIYSDDPIAVSFRETLPKHMGTVFKNVRSWMGLPLVVKDKAIGVLTLDHSEIGYYKPYHIELGMAFANQAAIEFENAKLYNETVKKADELKTMFAVQQAITSRLDLESVLKLIADESRRLINSYSTAVFLVEGDDLVFSIYSGDDYSKMMGLRVSIAESLLGKYLLQGKSVIFKNEPGNPNAHLGIISEVGVRTYLIVPLIANNKPVGIISAINKRSGEFDSEDERVLNMFASSAVIGIENARMYQEEKRRHLKDEQRRHVAEGLRDILAVLNSNRPLNEILDFIINEAARVMGTDSGSLYRLHKDKGVLVLEASCGLPGEFLSQTVIPLGAGAIGKTVAERKPTCVTDIPGLLEKSKDIPGLNPILKWLSENWDGILSVPLICKEEVYGGISLYFKDNKSYPGQKHDFSKEEIGLAMAFADQAALAIDNTRLRAQSEEMAVAAERNRLARDLHDAVTQTLFSASLIAEVLPRLWERNPDDGRKRLDELRQLTRGALAEMRTLLFELRPTTLVEANLEELLKQLTEAITGRARIPVALKVVGKVILPTEVKISFYRIAQEALNNIAKHSNASNATVSLLVIEDKAGCKKKAKIIISDDGRGFDPKTVTSEHLGVGIMRERADVIDACLTVDSRIGEGTNIILDWNETRDSY